MVIFDRIRENLRSKIKAPLDNIINKSINEVLQRTIITSVTTIFVLMALLTAGGEVIFTTIEKFRLKDGETSHPVLNTSSNNILIADEAHRS